MYFPSKIDFFPRFRAHCGNCAEVFNIFSGWDRYRGGLDVHNNMTGNEAIYTLFEDHQVMFHVSTLLPYTKDDKQQVNIYEKTIVHTPSS